ncbi:MAG TPA: transketolase [Clostridium sp.]|uniref:transketolase n=1 Tax=Clostridium sp. TaxID=1506 RepID=UPI002F9239FE
MVNIEFLKNKATDIRIDVLKMVYEAKTGHTGSSLSDTDILTVLYYDILNVDAKNPKWENRDRFILSKGHAVESLYCILADKGFFPKEKLQTYCKFGTSLIGHPNNKNPGVEMNSGALGHGLPIAVGMALAAKMNKRSYKVYTLMGDGEQAEGSVWEGAMAASNFNLDNLVAIIDRNKLQISGSTEDVMKLENLEDKWKSFGWNVIPVNGNDVEQLQRVLKNIPKDNKPTLIMAYTTKGKGVSFMENVAKWHHGVPSYIEMKIALEELNKQIGGMIYE